MKDKPARSADQTDDAQNATSEMWKKIASNNAEREGRAEPSTFEGLRQPDPEMLAMESSGALPNTRTSC